MKTALILTCAGKGLRAGFEKNKLLIEFDGTTTLMRTLDVFLSCNLIDQYIVTASKEDYDEIKSLVPSFVEVVIGGDTRTQSVINALSKVNCDIVLIHDGARPFISDEIILNTINSVKKNGSGIVAIPSRDTILSSTENNIDNYLGKDGLYSVQTPQGFLTKDIIKAYSLTDGKTFNDDGEVYLNAFKKASLVMGSIKNVKLTYPEDFEVFTKKDYRVGIGFDCHELVKDRKLILGGIEIPHDKGLLGHSDADVLTHAIMDAILSALALRDIGYHFPDNDNAYLNADSMKLLDKVLEMSKEKGYKIKNLSAVIMAEKPKLKNFIPTITKNLATALSISEKDVGITATTLEGLGFVGREEGICVNAIVMLTKI